MRINHQQAYHILHLQGVRDFASAGLDPRRTTQAPRQGIFQALLEPSDYPNGFQQGTNGWTKNTPIGNMDGKMEERTQTQTDSTCSPVPGVAKKAL